VPSGCVGSGRSPARRTTKLGPVVVVVGGNVVGGIVVGGAVAGGLDGGGAAETVVDDPSPWDEPPLHASSTTATPPAAATARNCRRLYAATWVPLTASGSR
jgi:hypothetical protein